MTPKPGPPKSLGQRISDWLDLPMAILAVVWAAVIMDELVAAARDRSKPVASTLGVVLWVVFLLDFALELIVAPDRRAFLRRNWLAALSVALPFVAVLRVFRALAALRTLLLARGAFVASAAGRTVKQALVHNYLGQVLVLFTLIVLFAATGIYYLEADQKPARFGSLSFTIYWAACMATTVNFGPEPISLGGRVIALALRVCGVGFFGYVAGGLASLIFGVRLSQPSQPKE